jgi:hypothetical protein
MKKYYGNHVGIVIQNNDPEKSGKVKVFVPYISPTVYQRWIQQKSNKSFKFLGNNIQSVLTQILKDQASTGSDSSVSSTIISVAEELKRILPWAECACPLVGENSSGRYNNTRQVGTTSDSNFAEDISPDIDSKTIPGKPAAFFEDQTYRLQDAFNTASNNINRPNPLSYEYIPSSYSNKAKGSFAIPSVGSHVWVFFRDGNPTAPVYFATTFGNIDWQGIFNSENGGIDYPNSFENKIQTEYNNNVDTYRNKFVINQKGGTIEMVNTDLNEKLKFTHFSGSFKEFNNQSNIELATKNSQKLVLNDQYETVKGFNNTYTGKSLDEIVMRDKYKKVGSLNGELFEQWKITYAIIQENKQLFEIKRTGNNNVLDTDGNVRLKRNSLLQTRSGKFANHPVTDGSVKYNTITGNQTYNTYNTTTNASSDGAYSINNSLSAVVNRSFPPTSRYLAESNTKWGPGGTGKSTSSQGGSWDTEDQKEILNQLIELNIQQLTEIEKQLGVGGSEITQIAKHKIETIGLSFNDYGSIRYDNIGKMLSNEVLVDDFGVYVNKKESPLVELVHVQDLPGGNYTITACNRMNILVGAGGLNIKSLGQTNITGTITNMVGEQVNIASSNEINIDAKTINISAEILRLRNKNQRQVLINESLGVNNNVIIGGGLHVEGETYIQHITAPKEYQVTEQVTLFGKFVSGQSVSVEIDGVSHTLKYTDTGTNIIECYPHSHVFANLPLTLLATNDAVRIAAKELNNGAQRSVSEGIHNQRK